jgi:hypothetical protein
MFTTHKLKFKNSLNTKNLEFAKWSFKRLRNVLERLREAQEPHWKVSRNGRKVAAHGLHVPLSLAAHEPMCHHVLKGKL